MITRQNEPSAATQRLLSQSTAELSAGYPPESTHLVPEETLFSSDFEFYLLVVEDEAIGCVGIDVGGAHPELKRMFVEASHRGRGFAGELLRFAIARGRALGRDRLRLETGVHQVAAIALYEKYGFERIAPFGSYVEDPNSLFFELRL